MPEEPLSDAEQAIVHLDEMDSLPRRSWVSTWSVLTIQAQNAFNDNLVKFVLIGLALVVAKGSFIGDNIAIITSSIIPIPFILLAPLAGYFSDHYAKRKVIFCCLIAQTAVFTTIWLGLLAKDIRIALLGFILLSIQSTFFSPAKQGIVKELVGSRRLGLVAGWMSMATMLAILTGMTVGGRLFASLEESLGDAWTAAARIVLLVGLGSLVPLALSLLVAKTPDHAGVQFHKSILFEHFVHLRKALRVRALRTTMLGLMFFWLVSYLLALFTINLGSEMFPDPADGGKAAEVAAKMTAMIGIGLIVGSLAVSFLSRRGIALWLVPVGAVGLALGMLGAALVPLGSSAFFGALIVVGLFGGAFNVPLVAFLQDRAAPTERGRVLSANNLLSSIAGLLAGAIVFGLTALEIPTHTQMLAVVLPTLVVAFLLWRRPPDWGERE